jgi:hypothetical protein
MSRHAPLILVLGAVACAPAAPVPRCKGNPGLVGQCYAVQGTLNPSADAAYVLWPDDTDRRAIKVRPAPNSDRDWPANVDRALMESEEEIGFAMRWVHGSFAVCPTPSGTPDDPENPFGCIEAADNLTAGTEIRRN